MGEFDQPFPSDALDATAYLARSENRVRVLQALDNGHRDRRDLVDAIDGSTATVGRVLQEFQDRGWAQRTADGYYLMAVGREVLAAFRPFIGTLTAIQHLGEAVDWIPTDEHPIELSAFRDAIVRYPRRDDPAEVTDYFLRELKATTSFRALTHLVPIEAKQREFLDGLRSGEMDVETVITDDLLAYLQRDPDHRSRHVDLIEAGYRTATCGERVPCNLFVFDDLVLLSESHPEDGNPYAAIVSQNPRVLAWANDLFEQYQERADPLRVQDFTDGDRDSTRPRPTTGSQQSTD